MNLTHRIALTVLVVGLGVPVMSPAGGHPNLIMTEEGVQRIRAELGQVPLFDATVEKVRTQVDAEIERGIAEFGKKAQDGTLSYEDLTGGTFSITNGGIFGSLLSTPILNPPQSGILGMHKIQDRPVAENGEVLIRPMMNVALSYDHRLVDGREAVQFLVTVKDALEDPARMLLGV